MNNPITKVILLGTGNPNPDPNHLGPSLAIVVNDKVYIIDFGPGIIRQTAALSPRYGGDIEALDCKNITKAFLTHLHSDHTIGFPDIILTPWVMGRDKPLNVYGPVGTKTLTRYILKAYAEDIKYRLEGSEPSNQEGWRVNPHEIDEGVIYSDNLIQVEAFNVKHGSMQFAFGFRFSTPNKTIVISGDTAPCSNIRKYSYGADILIHEVYSFEKYKQQEPSWQSYHAAHHTSTVELARLANETRPGLLVTYHTLYWGANDQNIMEEISSIYKGPINVGQDLLVIDD